MLPWFSSYFSSKSSCPPLNSLSPVPLPTCKSLKAQTLALHSSPNDAVGRPLGFSYPSVPTVFKTPNYFLSNIIPFGCAAQPVSVPVLWKRKQILRWSWKYKKLNVCWWKGAKEWSRKGQASNCDAGLTSEKGARKEDWEERASDHSAALRVWASPEERSWSSDCPRGKQHGMGRPSSITRSEPSRWLVASCLGKMWAWLACSARCPRPAARSWQLTAFLIVGSLLKGNLKHSPYKTKVSFSSLPLPPQICFPFKLPYISLWCQHSSIFQVK